MEKTRSADDARWLEQTAAAVTAAGGTLAWSATVGACSPTPVAASTPAVKGPRTVDAGELPLVAVASPGDAEAPEIVVTGRLGEGGMGVVELAHQRSLQRDVALKRVRPDAPPHVVAALLREAMFTGYLEHPSIVPVHALGRDEAGRPVMLMKRLEGVSLEALLDDSAHPVWARAGGDRLATVLEIGRKLCDAIAFAHSRGVLHRDLKPANVMLGAFGEVVLLDWGIATRVGERHAAGSIAGTLAYMAPEMLAPERWPSCWSPRAGSRARSSADRSRTSRPPTPSSSPPWPRSPASRSAACTCCRRRSSGSPPWRRRCSASARCS